MIAKTKNQTMCLQLVIAFLFSWSSGVSMTTSQMSVMFFVLTTRSPQQLPHLQTCLFYFI